MTPKFTREKTIAADHQRFSAKIVVKGDAVVTTDKDYSRDPKYFAQLSERFGVPCFVAPWAFTETSRLRLKAIIRANLLPK